MDTNYENHTSCYMCFDRYLSPSSTYYFTIAHMPNGSYICTHSLIRSIHTHMICILDISALFTQSHTIIGNGSVRPQDALAVAWGVSSISFVNCSMHCSYSATVTEGCLGWPGALPNPAATTDHRHVHMSMPS